MTVARHTHFKRRGAWAIVMSRFLFSALGGTINVISGADSYPYRRFVLYDVAGETLGAIIPLALGYAFGATWEDVGDLLTMGSLCVLTLLVTVVLIRRLFTLAQRLKASVHAAQQQLQKLDKQAVEIAKAVEDTLPLSQREG